MTYWREFKSDPPKEAGQYIIYSPSADPEKPFIQMAWFEPPAEWSMLPRPWAEGITHWRQKPDPPRVSILEVERMRDRVVEVCEKAGAMTEEEFERRTLLEELIRAVS